MKKSEQAAALAAVEAKPGMRVLRSGLGLAPGAYIFKTPDAEDIFHIKEVKSAKGEDWAITLVAGTVSGASKENAHVSKTFGLSDRDAQLGVSVDQWQGIDPNQVYDMIINDKGRIQSVLLASYDEIVPSSEVITNSTKLKSTVD